MFLPTFLVLLCLAISTSLIRRKKKKREREEKEKKKASLEELAMTKHLKLYRTKKEWTARHAST